MNISIDYSIRWMRYTQEPISPIPVSEAERRHRALELYVAFIKNDGKPLCFVEIFNNVYNVEFFDEQMRTYLVYNFVDRLKQERLFMWRYEHRIFDIPSKRISTSSIYNFWEEGRLLIQDRDFFAKTQSESEAKIDVSANWGPYPEFGKYERLISIERPAR